MYEDAASLTLGGLNVFYYGALTALGALIMLLTLAACCKKRQMPSGTAVLFGALALPLMLLCARLFFCLMDFKFRSVFSFKALVSFWGGGFSMIGALLGAALAALITARIQKIKALTVLDCLAPALMLFIAFARIGEGFVETLGRSRPLTSVIASIAWITESDGYDAYLRTYLFEALAALIIFVILSTRSGREKKAGDTLLTGMLLLGCAQTLLESLRFDAHMRISFVSLQQIAYAILFATPLMIFSARFAKARGKKGAVILSALLLLLVTGGAIGLEFAIDRSGVNRLLLYAVYALLTGAPIAVALYYKNGSERA